MQNKTLKITLNINAEHIVSEILIFLFLFYTAYVRLIDNTLFGLNVCNFTLLLAGLLNYVKALLKKDFSVVLLALFTGISWIICCLLRTEWNYETISMINTIAYISVAYDFVVEEKSTLLYGFLYYFVALYTLYALVIKGVPIRGFLKDGTSYNYISIVVLFYLCLYTLVQIKNKKRITMTQAIIFLVIVIVSYGRGGIVTGLSYLMLTLFAKFKENDKKPTTYLVTLSAFAFVLVMWNKLYSYVMSHGFFQKFQAMGLEGERSSMWSMYAKTCFKSAKYFYVGGNPGIFSVEGNLHNSFLQLYASFGILYLLVLVYVYIQAFRQMYIEKEWQAFVVAITFSLRAATDKLMFRGYCEIIFYFLIFYFILRNKRLDEQEDEEENDDGSIEEAAVSTT